MILLSKVLQLSVLPLGFPIMSLETSLSSSHSCFQKPSLVSFPSVHKHIQVSLLNETSLIQFSLRSPHYHLPYLPSTTTPRKNTLIFSTSSNHISFSFTVHFPPYPNLQIPPVFLSPLTAAPLPQCAKLQIRVFLKIFSFSVWATWVPPKSDFMSVYVMPGLSTIFDVMVLSWELYENHLESFSKYLHEQSYPPNHLPIQAHVHSLSHGLSTSLGRKKDFGKCPQMILVCYTLTPILKSKASICPKDKNVLVYEIYIYTHSSYIKNSEALKYLPLPNMKCLVK